MDIIQLFERDLNKLIEEISLFKSEEDVWKIKKGISNSAGNLTLHLIGNLNYFIGTALGHTNYIREREKEFTSKDISRKKLIADLQTVSEIIETTLTKVPVEDLKNEHPILINDEHLTTEHMLIYLLAHLNYHLGQVNYLRRMLS